MLKVTRILKNASDQVLKTQNISLEVNFVDGFPVFIDRQGFPNTSDLRGKKVGHRTVANDVVFFNGNDREVAKIDTIFDTSKASATVVSDVVTVITYDGVAFSLTDLDVVGDTL